MQMLFCDSFLGSSLTLFGQASQPPAERGFVPGKSYALSDIESINVTNGNLVLQIPLGSLPPGQAGMTADIKLIYNSMLYDLQVDITEIMGEPFTTETLIASDHGGWRYGFEYQLDPERRPLLELNPGPVDCLDQLYQKSEKLTLILPDRSRHDLNLHGFTDLVGDQYFDIDPNSGFWACPPPPGAQNPIPSPLNYYTTDGSFILVQHDYVTDTDIIFFLTASELSRQTPARSIPMTRIHHLRPSRSLTATTTSSRSGSMLHRWPTPTM